MCVCTHTGLEGERGQVISGCQLPNVFQAEPHSRGQAFCRGAEGPERAVYNSDWTIIYLKTSDRKCPEQGKTLFITYY